MILGNEPIVTSHVARLPGMTSGEVGIAGMDQPGPSIRTVAIPVTRFIGVEVLYSFLRSFFGLLAVDGLGLADLAPPGDAFSHLWRIAGIACAPATLALLQELYDYLGKVREVQKI